MIILSREYKLPSEVAIALNCNRPELLKLCKVDLLKPKELKVAVNELVALVGELLTRLEEMKSVARNSEDLHQEYRRRAATAIKILQDGEEPKYGEE